MARMMSSEDPSELERLRLQNEQLSESLRLAEEVRDRYVDRYDHAPLAYLTLTSVGVILEMNQSAVALLGTHEPGRQMVGARVRRFLADSDHATLANHLKRCAASWDAVTCELHLRDGTLVQLWSRRTQPDPRLFPTLIVDLTDREMALEEARRLRRAEQIARAESAAKDTFIATLSHELRTPLTPVLAAVTALRMRTDVPPALRPIFEVVRRNIMTEARLIDDLLDVTRISRGKMGITRQPFDVHEIVREAVEMLKPEVDAKHLTVEVSLDAEGHCASVDPVRLKQVFWNLLTNAVRFTEPLGQIHFRSWNSASAAGRRLAVEVSDTGRGFAPEAAARLLEPFEQGSDLPERNGGLGLGLAICRGIMSLHGGQIAASSRGPGMGARFVIELETIANVPPPAEAAPAYADSNRLAPTTYKPRVLLVDDHEDTVEMLGELLVDAGYEVHTARSAKSAMAADLAHVDLVVSDIGLPDLSGLELMKTLRATHQLEGIALSGYGTEADVQASKNAGFSVHLTKPVDFERLLDALRDLARSPERQSSRLTGREEAVI